MQEHLLSCEVDIHIHNAVASLRFQCIENKTKKSLAHVRFLFALDT